MIYIVTYRSQFDSYVVAAFYDEDLAYNFAQERGHGYIVECFIGPRKIR